MKRLFDIFVASLLLVLLSPLMLVTALVVRRKLGRPVIFKQIRPGLNGQPFALYKYRTMTDARDEKGELLPDGARLTRTGHLLRQASLDELPQLINVLKGELSLVGPRPLLMQYLPLYNTFEMRRHEVKPGITGWAQVNGRNSLAWQEKFKMDVWYVEHQSVWLDMKILYRTVLKVVKRDGISQEGQSTMEVFTGSTQKIEKSA
ncbi:sugar transferase [Salinicoccus sesuvii]|uniref:Sugar transferase n=1 Tax=Salinicoccus sesuvii TaxID=868281 RepID=A0ABV7N887_9STAP